MSCDHLRVYISIHNNIIDNLWMGSHSRTLLCFSFLKFQRWNDLLMTLRNSQSLPSFQQGLRIHFFKKK